MAVFVWSAAIAGNWSTGANWSVGGVPQAAPPTAADDVLFGSGTGATNSNCTVTAASVCNNLDRTGYSGTMSGSGDLSVSAGLILGTAALSGTWTIKLVATTDNGGAGWNVTFNGTLPVGNFTCDGVNGKWVFTDTFPATTKTLTLTNGNLVLTNRTVNCSTFIVSAGGTCDIAGTTFNLSRTAAGNSIQFVSTSTITGGATSTIVIFTASTSTRTVAAGGKALGALTYIVAGSTGQLTVSGGAATTSFTTITCTDITNARIIAFTAAQIFTFTSLVCSGSSGKLISIVSTVAGTPTTLTNAGSQVVSLDFLSVKDITAAGLVPFYAGVNSTDAGGNTGWVFGPPAGTPAPSDRGGLGLITRQRSHRKERFINNKTPYYSQHRGR